MVFSQVWPFVSSDTQRNERSETQTHPINNIPALERRSGTMAPHGTITEETAVQPIPPLPQRELFIASPGQDTSTSIFSDLTPESTSNSGPAASFGTVSGENEAQLTALNAGDVPGDTDSAVDASQWEPLTGAMQEAMEDRVEVLFNFKQEGSKDPVLDTEYDVDRMNRPRPPSDWKVPERRGGQPDFKDVDNPGNWDDFTFRPLFENKKGCPHKYKHHRLPTGATPVPADQTGNRVCAGLEFHYDKWECDLGDGIYRSSATPENLFPDDRKGQLDYDLLQDLGCTAEKISNCDALFFYQLLMPIGSPQKVRCPSGRADPRKSYYLDAQTYTAMYAAQQGMYGPYGHEFRTVTVDDLLHFDGAIIRDGVMGRSDGAIYERWNRESVCCCDDIRESLSYSRFLQIKRVLKLCFNGEAKNQRTHPDYDPAYKYDLIYDVLCHNTNAITKYCDSDQCGDETTYSTQGYGEPQSDLVSRVHGKPGITRGGQIVMLFDASRTYARPRAYVHRHKCHKSIPGLTSGPLEVKMLIDQLLSKDILKEKFRSTPHITMDNYFCSDAIMDHIGSRGLGATMTTRRDRLPKGVSSMYFHKEQTAPGDRRARVARFLQPITAVKTTALEDGTSFTRAHCSFQSTSSCNISTVNALNRNGFFATPKERGMGVNKRKWLVENNDARLLYLNIYGQVDTVDLRIRKCNLFYVSWKYWHAARLHGLGLALVVAYDIYLELAKEASSLQFFGLDKTPPPLVSFRTFRDILSKAALQYSSKNCFYAGDMEMRSTTKKRRAQRIPALPSRPRGRPRKGAIPPEHNVTEEMYKKAYRPATKSRLCGDLTKLHQHICHLEHTKHPHVCKVCGENAYTICTLCPGRPALHFFPSRGQCREKGCYIDYHDESKFGLCRDDATLVGKKLQDWVPPSNAAIKHQRKHIQEIKANAGVS